MREIQTESGTRTSLPWPLAAACLVAFGTLFITGGFSPMLPLYGVLVLCSYATRWRVDNERHPYLPWVLFMAGFACSIALRTLKQPDSDSFVDPSRLSTVGEMFGAVITVACWCKIPFSGPGMPVVILLSAFIMLNSCFTVDQELPKYASPIYALFITLAMPLYRPRGAAVGSAPGRGLQRAFALAAALVVGTGLCVLLVLSRSTLNNLYSRFAGWHPPMEFSGLSATPRLGATFDLQGSYERVLKLQDYKGDPHLRGLTFSQYFSGSWGPPYSERSFETVRAGDLNVQVNADRARITRLSSQRGLLFAPLDALSLELTDTGTLGVDVQNGWCVRTERDFTAPRGPLDYEVVTGELPLARHVLNQPLRDGERRRDLYVSRDIAPGVWRVAQEIARSAPTPTARARAVEAYLMANHEYSLRTRPGAGDPLSAFVLSHQAAHCEYFAAGAVMLLRCMGIPARYVTGYYAHESLGNDQIVVRGRDAHAWAECYIEGHGWMTVDATPADGRPDRLRNALPWDWQLRERLSDLWERAKDFLANMTPAQAILMVVATLLLLVLAMLWNERKRRADVPPATVEYTPASRELSAAAARYEALLRRAGAPPPSARPWAEHLGAIAQPGFPRAEAAAFVAAYYRARFGPADPDASAQLKQHLDALAQAVETMRKNRPATPEQEHA